jgi:hypothetical protein
MTAMTARDEATRAVWDAVTNLSTGEVADLVDAIPGDVLVRLAIERGALERYIVASFDRDTPPLYRLVDR